MLDAAEKARAQAHDRTRGLDLDQALGQLAEENAQLEPREVGSQAEVFPDAEGQMAVGLTIHPEREGLREHLLVAIGRGIEEAHRLTGADLLPSQLEVLGGRAAELDHGRGPAHDLLHRNRDELGIPPQLLELAGMLRERQQATAHRVASGLVAGHHQ